MSNCSSRVVYCGVRYCAYPSQDTSPWRGKDGRQQGQLHGAFAEAAAQGVQLGHQLGPFFRNRRGFKQRESKRMIRRGRTRLRDIQVAAQQFPQQMALGHPIPGTWPARLLNQGVGQEQQPQPLGGRNR